MKRSRQREQATQERGTAVYLGEGSLGWGDVVRMGEMADQDETTTCLHGGSPARHGWEEVGTPEPLGGGGGNPRAEKVEGGGSAGGDGRVGRDDAVAAPAE